MFILATTDKGEVFINLDNVTVVCPYTGKHYDYKRATFCFIDSEDYLTVEESFEEIVDRITSARKRG